MQQSTDRRFDLAAWRWALFVAAGCWLSQVTNIPGTPFGILWLPPSLVLVGLMTRGYSVLLPAVVGLTSFLWWQQTPTVIIATSTLSMLAGPIAANFVLRRVLEITPAQPNLNRFISLFGSIALVFAPICAIVTAIGISVDQPQGFDVLAVVSWRWATEMTTGIIFVRGLISWRDLGNADIAQLSELRRRLIKALTSRDNLPLLIMIAIALFAVVIGSRGDGFAERTLVIPIFGVACVCAIAQRRFNASNAIMLSAVLNAALRVEGFKIGRINETAEVLLLLAEFQSLLLVGSVLAHLLNVLTDERLSQAKQLRHQALTNTFTNLPNLRSLNEYLTTPERQAGGSFSGLLLAELSITGLHQWADIAGRTDTAVVEQEIADRLLTTCAHRIHELFHLETGRFVFSLRDKLDDGPMMHDLSVVFDQSTYRIGNHNVRIQYSVGFLDVPPGHQDHEAILASLAISQRRAIVSNSNYCRLDLNHERVQEYREAMAWTETIKHYLENQALRLFAQPIRQVRAIGSDKHRIRYEILARIEDNNGVLLTPDRFMPAIAKAGLQTRFDHLVIELTLDTLLENKALYSITKSCAINVTGPSICNPLFADQLHRSLAFRNLNPTKISIEITESDSITNLEAAAENIRELRSNGITVAVDDFGTGQATYEYIRKLRPDILKIDGTFVTRYQLDPLDREIVKSITRLAQSIGAETVAEFVETDDIAGSMAAIGVDYLQGWAISKPMPINELTSKVRTNQIDQEDESALNKSEIDATITHGPARSEHEITR